MGLTYVTAFMDLSEDRSTLRSPETHMKHFRSIAATGAPIILFLSPTYEIEYRVLCGNLPNVHVEYKALKEFYVSDSIDSKMPPIRNHVKDTRNFLTFTNCKLECLHLAMQMPHFSATHYAWIDFGIKHVLSDVALEQIKHLAATEFITPCLAIPGCLATITSYFDRVNWRFCGGFLLGDRASLQKLYEEGHRVWKSAISEYGLTWEVNYWAYLEYKGLVPIQWYKADHNDTILNVPTYVKAASISSEATSTI
jgi:hypothetical protein